MRKSSYYVVNGITFYRLIAAPFLLLLICTNQLNLFKWLLAFSFLTDAVDGYLARKYRVVSILGAKLDSIADDMTVLVALIGLFIWNKAFLKHEYIWVLSLAILFVVQFVFALIRYRRPTSFHTYLAKVAAVFQAAFLVLSFFLPTPMRPLFYATVILTALDIIEETIMVAVLPKWQSDVRSLYHAFKQKRSLS